MNERERRRDYLRAVGTTWLLDPHAWRRLRWRDVRYWLLLLVGHRGVTVARRLRVPWAWSFLLAPPTFVIALAMPIWRAVLAPLSTFPFFCCLPCQLVVGDGILVLLEGLDIRGHRFARQYVLEWLDEDAAAWTGSNGGER